MSGVFEEQIEYGPGGYDTTQPNNNVTATSQLELSQEKANERNLYGKALQALAGNQAFLALPNPTSSNTDFLGQPAIPSGTLSAAQLGAALRIVRTQTDNLTRQNNALIAQNIALTRQVNALIRFLVDDFGDISDT